MTEEQGQLIANSIMRWLKILSAVVVLCLLVSVGVGAYAYWQAAETHDALCKFRDNLEGQVTATEEFLKDHPEGFAGVPAPVLQQRVAAQRSTLASLQSLDCAPLTLDEG